ncbi:expressed unknown protein [Seminavis robusta]|uniref:Uncharacterized protein n=1 Tax=Seminavis robusta TaxID=568900 RepID=A0A9N8E5J5_9STRA|nr:expressed unknown protein [Seminavis robusta]|eukprot:Sro674_g185381.1  (150) ;mRNA; f:36038-36487
MQIPQFLNEFDLKKCYCVQHGRKLECQQALHEELLLENFEIEIIEDGRDDANDDPKKNRKECADCVHLDYDEKYCRCVFCEKFVHNEYAMHCHKSGCHKTACYSCVYNDLAVIEYCYRTTAVSLRATIVKHAISVSVVRSVFVALAKSL